MVPERLIKAIDQRLTLEIGQVDEMKKFVFQFAALPAGHDLDYALEELKTATGAYKLGIQIFLEEIAK